MAQVKSIVLQQWKSHKKSWRRCTRCEIGRLAAKHVFGRGQLPCDVLFIGEGPGKSEDVLGEPFVGISGRILDSWIAEVISKTTLRWAVTNIVACRPTDRLGGPNRAPTKEEICNCESRLVHFVKEIARPAGFRSYTAISCNVGRVKKFVLSNSHDGSLRQIFICYIA